ncbi:hypothetical protein GDO86_001076 [Hymenochirus boettgeri]|uniref:Ig-like domain-containing protein n=2 Tax=Hymenochirus TaxID=8361 RepID=A0A8T2KH43_9PIPI|nr:hypothetical protein GDO86_001076 [Hymenochirus boettgeri]
MKRLGLFALPAMLLLLHGTNVECTDPNITTSQQHVTEHTVTLSCYLWDNTLPISGHRWLKGSKLIKEDQETAYIMTYNVTGLPGEGSGQYTCQFLSTIVPSEVLNVTVPPQVHHYKATEHGNEGDTGVLTCKSYSFPPVDQWAWYVVTPSGAELLGNGSTDRYSIKSTGNQTVLRIQNLDIEKDQHDYMCNGTNDHGNKGDTIHLHVRSRLAAVWPFLGIVGEVVVLVTIIFIYEKRRKPDEVPEDEDSGSGALKGNTGANHDTLRQRNSS